MSIPVEAMHEDIKNVYLGQAEALIEGSDDYNHPVAGRDAVRLAYVLWEEAGNPELWTAAVNNYRNGG